jgi:hypothetical protein
MLGVPEEEEEVEQEMRKDNSERSTKQLWSGEECLGMALAGRAYMCLDLPRSISGHLIPLLLLKSHSLMCLFLS